MGKFAERALQTKSGFLLMSDRQKTFFVFPLGEGVTIP